MYFEDFQIFFQSRPVPGLYLKPFKSYSQSKTTTILSTWQNTKSWKKIVYCFFFVWNYLWKTFNHFFSQRNFEDFRIFFHSRPIPSLYLKRFKSYSSSKWNTDYLEFFFSYGIVKTILDYFYAFFYYAQTPQDRGVNPWNQLCLHYLFYIKT